MNSGAAGFIPISGGGAASIAKTPSLWNSIKNIPSMIKVFGPNLWKKLLGAKDNVLKNGADVLKYLEDLTAEKLVASNGQVLTKSQADELLGKVGGSTSGSTYVKGAYDHLPIHQRPLEWLQNEKMDEVIDHILNPSLNSAGAKATGGHHFRNLTDNKNLKIVSSNHSPNNFGEVEFKIFRKDYYNGRVLEFESWKKNLKAEGKNWEDYEFPNFGNNVESWKNMDRFWTESKKSSLYPDTWTQSDIKLKISEAWENGVKKVIDDKGYKHFIAKTDEGIPLEFAIKNEPSSVFANFDSLKWK